MISLRSTLTFLLLIGHALAHLQMSDPFPIMTTLNPAVKGGDVDLKSPLAEDGSQFPCKGYLTLDVSFLRPQATWAAGSSQTFTAAGTANHEGGSCQLSLSYDMGQTWNVIMSYIGGCMAESKTLEIKIPSEAPSGEAIFSWTWFNRTGRREMYQNCAVITVTNGGKGLNSQDHPALFVANAPIVTADCATVEGQDAVFPNPGTSVAYSGKYTGEIPPSGRGIVGTNCFAPGGADGAGTSGGTIDESDGDQIVAPISSQTFTSSESSFATSISHPSIISKPCGKAKHPTSTSTSRQAVTVNSEQPALISATVLEVTLISNTGTSSVLATQRTSSAAASARPTRARKCRRRRSTAT